MEKEIWKDINGFEGSYQASNLGNIRSVDRTVHHKDGKVTHHKGRVLKPSNNTKGYPTVYLTRHSKKYTKPVHRLVGLTFIPEIEGMPQINHINGIKNDNRVENLEWCDNKQNCRHANDTGLRKVNGEQIGTSKLKRHEAIFIIDSYKQLGVKKITEMFNIDRTSAWAIWKGKSWKQLDKFRVENAST